MSDSIPHVPRSGKKESDPKMVGLWKIGRTIGRGASGRVRIARHSKTGQYAAVKIISKEVALGSNMSLDEDVRRAEREIVVMKLIDHPNLMRLYDVWETSTDLYLILEYVEGGELFDYLCEKGRLPTSEALGYFQQIITAIHYCHCLNIAHRDLKPENLLLDADHNIKIADFGMAVWQSKNNMLHTACGSPHYAAPEVLLGDAYNGVAADTWSCGVILYLLLSGRLPFDDDELLVLYEKVKIGKFFMPTDIDPLAKDLITKMLEKDPSKRISIPEILKHPFYLSQAPKVLPRKAPDLEATARPLASVADIDPAIFTNLRTLWPNILQSDLEESLTSPKTTWEKGVYHLLVQYRATQLENYDEEEEKLAAKRKAKRTKRKNQRVRIAEDLPPRTGPPTPRRANRRQEPDCSPSPTAGPSQFRQLTSVGSNIFTPDVTSPAVPEVHDEQIQNFFEQIEEHLNVMQTTGQQRTVDTEHSLVPKTPMTTPLAVNFGTPFNVRSGNRDLLASTTTDTFAHMSRGSSNTRPLSIRRREEGDKENAKGGPETPSYLKVDCEWPARKSSLRSNSSAGSRADRHVLIVEPRSTGTDSSKLRKKFSIKRSRTPSSPGSNFTGHSSIFFSSTPKRTWFGGLFRAGPSTYQLLSTEDAYATRRECRQILEGMGVSVMLIQEDGMGTLKCRLDKIRDPAGVMASVKPVRFRVEMRIPTTVQAVAGYTVAMHITMEKGALSSFKFVYGRLRREWTLDASPAGYMMENRPEQYEDDTRFVEIVCSP